METVIKREQFTFHFPDEWDERAEWEMPMKGYLSEAIVELANGARYPVNFYDPTRLRQDMEAGLPWGEPCLADPGMIVVPEVTREVVLAAVDYLIGTGYFETQHPLSPGAASTNGTPGQRG